MIRFCIKGFCSVGQSLVLGIHLKMRQPSLGAALAAVLIIVLLWSPHTSGLHLVSNQPTGTDNQNNPPVQYVPKMASKLGLPQPQNREPEVLTDEALATAVRQLIESHKRQSAFLERLAALATKSKSPETFQKKKMMKPPGGTSQISKTSESVIMRPAKRTENVFTPNPVQNPEAHISNQTVEKVSLNSTPIRNVQYSSNPSHHSVVRPVRHFVSYVPQNSNLPAHLPVSHYPVFQGYYPHFVGEGSHTQNNPFLPQGHPLFNIQYPHNQHPVNAQTANVVPPISHEYKTQFPVNSYPFPVNSHEFPVNYNQPDENAQQYSYIYSKRPQGH